MGLLLEMAAFLLGQKLAEFTWNSNELIESNVALKKEHLTKIQLENRILSLEAQIQESQLKKSHKPTLTYEQFLEEIQASN